MNSNAPIAILKYNAGNIQSVLFAMERIGVEASVTDDPDMIRSAAKVIFPGVGEAGSAMRYLRERGLDDLIRELKQPVLGVCLGMQLLCQHTTEGDTPCLGIFPTGVTRFDHAGKIPQVGWNSVSGLKGELFREVPEESYTYFVHSYRAGLCEETIAVTEYGGSFSSALQRDNFYGVQFHPEKSARVGEQILRNFINL